MLKEISVLKGDDMRIGWWLEGEWKMEGWCGWLVGVEGLRG